jgi:hypothetical protein
MVSSVGFLFLILGAAVPRAFAETHTFPIRVDYPLLRSLVVYTAFPEPGDSATLSDQAHGCNSIVISNPQFSAQDSLVRLEVHVKAKGGVFLFGACRMSVDWEGYLVLLQRPLINAETWIMSFQVVDSEVYDMSRRPASIAGLVWDLIKDRVFDYLAKITVNLGPPVQEVKGFLFPLFPEDRRQTALKMFESMRPGEVTVSPVAIRVEILAEVEPHEGKERSPKEEVLSAKEIDSFVAVWETWDSFLVQMILSLFGEPLSRTERETILEILLDTRHSFTLEIQRLDPAEELNRDFVREQFVRVWGRISPILRNHLGTRPSESITSYLCFFTAADALTAIDKIGRSLGIEISRAGLVRLVRLISSGEAAALTYSAEVLPSLREVLGLGKPLSATGPGFDFEELDTDVEEPSEGESRPLGELSFLERMMRFFVRPCDAQSGPSKKELEAIRPWIPAKKGTSDYLERIKEVLRKATEETLASSGVPKELKNFFLRMVLATCWQESCFRQFVEKGGKITYLKSYNNTSVGLMQINERVWRGIYEPKHLRWDVSYNAKAGCQILEKYLVTYALRDRPSPGSEVNAQQDLLARLLYAMYNGGPGERGKFEQRSAKNQYQLSDRLFFEKYNWVVFNEWANITGCLQP